MIVETGMRARWSSLPALRAQAPRPVQYTPGQVAAMVAGVIAEAQRATYEAYDEALQATSEAYELVLAEMEARYRLHASTGGGWWQGRPGAVAMPARSERQAQAAWRHQVLVDLEESRRGR